MVARVWGSAKINSDSLLRFLSVDCSVPDDRVWRKRCFEGLVVVAADSGSVDGVQDSPFCNAQGRWYSGQVQPNDSVGQRQHVRADFAVVSVNDPTVRGICDSVSDDL